MNLPAEPAPALRRNVATWEVELLISGVAVFAMLQLPGLLDDALFMLLPRFGDGWQMALLLVFMYAKGAALILSLTFVLHLLLRAHWIALVGVHAVHPDGIRWERLRIGPILREVEMARDRPFSEIVRDADARATLVFAMGVTLAMFVVAIATTALLVSALATLVSLLSGGRLGVNTVLLVTVAAAMLPFSLAMIYDRARGARLDREGRLYRWLRRVFDLYTRIGFSRTSNPVMALLGSHGGDRKVVGATMVMIFLALLASTFPLWVHKAPTRLGSYGLFPAGKDVQAIDNAHYDDQRDATRVAALPYIPSMMVTTPYLRLVVPYRPERDAPALERACAQPGQAQASARLACLTALHAVTLDGKPLPALRYEITSDPRTRRPALLAMIDVRGLPRGRHELHIARPPLAEDSRDNDRKYDRIPFWL